MNKIWVGIRKHTAIVNAFYQANLLTHLEGSSGTLLNRYFIRLSVPWIEPAGRSEFKNIWLLVSDTLHRTDTSLRLDTKKRAEAKK